MHPSRIRKILAGQEAGYLLGGLKQFGLDGMELNYPSHNEQDRRNFSELMEKYRLLPTGGSDFHGDEDKNFVYDMDPRTAKKLHV